MSIIDWNYIKITTIYKSFIKIKWPVNFRKDLENSENIQKNQEKIGFPMPTAKNRYILVLVSTPQKTCN